jgi:hypothetical protein
VPSQPDSDDPDDEASFSIIPNPPSSVVSSAGTLSLIDLRLMHHWSTSTFRSIFIRGSTETDVILQQHVPDLAFRNNFLMQGLLGAASLHLQRMVPYPQVQLRKRTDVYRAQALSTFRKALDSLVPDTESYDAALVMSLVLLILCSQDYQTDENDLTTLHWLNLYGGLRSIIYIQYPHGSAEKSISPLLCRQFTDILITPAIPTVLLNMIRMIDYTDPDYPGVETYCRALDTLGTLYASLTQNGLTDDLYIRSITFCSYATDEFVTFARERRPRALVIIMYYLSFLKLVQSIWWVLGVAERDMPVIVRMIEPKWLVYMDIPLRIMKMTDSREIAELLLK